MGESKYGKYIVTEYLSDKFEGKDPPTLKPMTYIDGNYIEGAFYAECVWFTKASESSPPVHTHEDFDEILMFYGSDPANPKELNGEVELWLGDEKHILTKSCMVFIPKGIRHCPMIFRRIDKPILHLSTGPMTNYKRDKEKSK